MDSKHAKIFEKHPTPWKVVTDVTTTDMTGLQARQIFDAEDLQIGEFRPHSSARPQENTDLEAVHVMVDCVNRVAAQEEIPQDDKRLPCFQAWKGTVSTVYNANVMVPTDNGAWYERHKVDEAMAELSRRLGEVCQDNEALRREFIQQDPHGDELRATIIMSDDIQVTQKQWDDALVWWQQLTEVSKRCSALEGELALEKARRTPAPLTPQMALSEEYLSGYRAAVLEGAALRFKTQWQRDPEDPDVDALVAAILAGR